MLLRMSNSRSRSSSETPSSDSPRVTAPMAKMPSISGCAAGGEPQQAHAAVPAMEQPLDQPRLLQPVEDAGERDRLDLEELGQRALLDALVARQMRQHLALRPGQPEVARILLEALAHQAGHVVQEEAEIAVEIVHIHIP